MKDLINLAISCGATRAGMVQVAKIRFEVSFRQLCEMNTCGHYQTNWMCPPAIGPFNELMGRVKKFEIGVVLQSVRQLEDSFDYPGMTHAAEEHDQVFRDFRRAIRNKYPSVEILSLNAGFCRFCQECSIKNKVECPYPDEAIASLEAYGIDVNALVSACGLAYNNGPATVSYAGMIMFGY